MKHTCILAVVSAMIFAFSACGIKPTAANGATNSQQPDALMEEWRAIAASKPEEVDQARIIQIANTLAEHGPEALEPFFAVIEDPDATPVKKMLAVMSLSAHVDQSHAPRLMALSEPEHDAVTRGCAVHLLNNTGTPEAVFHVRDLMDDEDPHVSKVATMVMLRTGHGEALERTLALWDAPDTSAQDRTNIVLGIPDMVAMACLRVFEEACCNEELERHARQRAIQVLEFLGNEDSLPAVAACLEAEEDAELRTMLEAARAEIQKRVDEGVTLTPMQIPAGMDIQFKAIPPDEAEEQEEDTDTEE